MADPAPPRITVLTRPGCHLCEAAVAVIAEVCADTGDQWVQLDITDRPNLAGRYTDQIPVTFVDGAQHDYWRVDPTRLRAALTARPR